MMERGGLAVALGMFTPENRLPAGAGFSLFGPEHLAVLAVLTVLSFAVVLYGCKTAPARREWLLRFLAGAMVAMEVAKDVALGTIGAFSVGYLPLHLCSLAMFICLFFAWHPASLGAGQLVWGVCFSGGLAALIFPDWTNMPFFHFQSLHSFLYHAMLVQFSLICVISGMARPRVKQVWRALLFLAAAAAVIYPINLLLHTNYMFINRPLPGTPLALCARLPGRVGYLTGCALLASAVLVLLDLPFSLWQAGRSRRSGEDPM